MSDQQADRGVFHDSFAEGLESFFSILPDEQAIEAKQKTLQNYVGRADLSDQQVKWANFDAKGNFINGGVSDLAGLSTKLIMAEQNDDDDINRLIELVREGGVKPGLLEYSISRNSIFWYLPFLIDHKGTQPQNGMRALLIPESLVHEILDIFNSDIKITQAEKHLIFQLVAGFTLRQAAEIDKLAFETKRAQLKAVCSKMQCGGQTDLLREVLGQLSYLLSVCELRKGRSGRLEAFIRDFLSSDTRMTVQRLSNGRSIRILERGPVDGMPILLIHGMLWPMLFCGDGEALKTAGVRLLVPIRAGYIDRVVSEGRSAEDDLVAQSLQDIALYQKETMGGAATVVGYSNGGSIALKFAALFPDLVSQLVIVSINSSQGTERSLSFVGKFFNGIQYFANRPGVLRYLTWQFKKYYTDEQTVTRILRKIFAASKTDTDLIDGNGGIPPIYKWFIHMFQHSIPGIADDFNYVMGDWQNDLAQIASDVRFIHGTEDNLVDIETLKPLVGNKSKSTLDPIVGGGHHILTSHSSEIWKTILRP